MTTNPSLIKTPKSKLKAGVIYSGDNGSLFCSYCAGSTAKYTGRDISGQRIMVCHQEESIEWEQEFGKPMSCERGCTVYPRAAALIASKKLGCTVEQAITQMSKNLAQVETMAEKAETTGKKVNGYTSDELKKQAAKIKKGWGL